MKQKGAHLVTGTVRTYYDNEELKVDVQEKDNGFVVETKHDLSGTHAIYVTYDVVFEEASLDGRDVTNIATTCRVCSVCFCQKSGRNRENVPCPCLCPGADSRSECLPKYPLYPVQCTV